MALHRPADPGGGRYVGAANRVLLQFHRGGRLGAALHGDAAAALEQVPQDRPDDQEQQKRKDEIDEKTANHGVGAG